MDLVNSSLETARNSIAKRKLRHHGPLQIEGFTGWKIAYSVCP
jgi:hypothetical protein